MKFWFFCLNDIIFEKDGEWFVIDKIMCVLNGMFKIFWFFLLDIMNVSKVRGFLDFF